MLFFVCVQVSRMKKHEVEALKGADFMQNIEVAAVSNNTGAYALAPW